MASASSSYYISFVFALLSMCIHLCAGAFLLDSSTGTPSQKKDNDPNPTATLAPSPTFPPTPAPAPVPASASVPAPASVPLPVPTPYMFNSPMTVPTSHISPESTKHKRGRILGLVLISFVGVLQAFVVLFLFIKRRQMLKHLHGSRDHHDPAHIWSNV